MGHKESDTTERFSPSLPSIKNEDSLLVLSKMQPQEVGSILRDTCNVDISYCCFLLSRVNIHQFFFFFNYSICFILSWVYNGFDKSAISVIIKKKKKSRTQQLGF